MKNKFLWINAAAAVLSVLILGFLALPFVARVSGYGMFEYYEILGRGIDFTITWIYLAPLFAVILSALLLGFNTVAVLGNVGVIKNKKLLKIFRIVKLALAAILAFVLVLTLVFVLINKVKLAIGIILIMIFTFAILAGTIVDLVLKRK